MLLSEEFKKISDHVNSYEGRYNKIRELVLVEANKGEYNIRLRNMDDRIRKMLEKDGFEIEERIFDHSLFYVVDWS